MAETAGIGKGVASPMQRRRSMSSPTGRRGGESPRRLAICR